MITKALLGLIGKVFLGMIILGTQTYAQSIANCGWDTACVNDVGDDGVFFSGYDTTQRRQQDERPEKKYKMQRIDVPLAERASTAKLVGMTPDNRIAAFGESWQDSRRMIWGDIVRGSDGYVHFMNHQQATDYCDVIRINLRGYHEFARLPKRNEFKRLREAMGASPNFSDDVDQQQRRFGVASGYRAQVLPNLTYFSSDRWGDTFHGGYSFWSFDINKKVPEWAFVFDGRDGLITSSPKAYGDGFDEGVAVRCVAVPK